MFTAQERAEMQYMVMEEIRHVYMELVKKGQLYETMADQVLDHMELHLKDVREPELLLRKVSMFVQAYPAFQRVHTKLAAYQDEIVQRISEEALEEVMESDPDSWSELIEQVQELDAKSFKSWIATLPFSVFRIMQKSLNQRENAF